VTRYLADKTALARLHLPAVRARMKEQLEASLDRVDTPEDIWEQAAEIQEALTEQAQHRSASIPDLIVAATARARGPEILHYDRDFETLARDTGQPTRWIVPPDTV